MRFCHNTQDHCTICVFSLTEFLHINIEYATADDMAEHVLTQVCADGVTWSCVVTRIVVHATVVAQLAQP